MNAHTPGPWSRSDGWAPTLQVVDHENIYGAAPAGVVAKVVRASQDGVYTPEKEANARLIAAAPEMYALVLEYVARFTGQQNAHFDRARALLARIDHA